MRLHQGDIDSVLKFIDPRFQHLVRENSLPRRTFFVHQAYLDEDIYPEGIADIVGYWTEDRMLGGVAVFDRKAEKNPEIQPPNVYFHSTREDATFRVWQLRDEQQQSLVDFLLAETETPPPSPCPLPIINDVQNRVRVDAHEAITHFQIYRDIWERKPPNRQELMFLERRPRGEFDYPEIGEMIEIVNSDNLPVRSPSRSPPIPD